MKLTFTPDLFLMVGPDQWHGVAFGPLTVQQLLDALQKWSGPEELYRASYDTNHPEHAWVCPLCLDALRSYNDLTAEDDGPTHSFAGWRWLGISISGKTAHSEARLWITQETGEDPHDACEAHVPEETLTGRVRTAALQAIDLLKESLDA
jgi:hypothetical protein